jgi:hypothetical protein
MSHSDPMLRNAYRRLRTILGAGPNLLVFLPLLLKHPRTSSRSGSVVALNSPDVGSEEFESWHRQVIARDLLFEIEIARGPT